MKEQLRKRTILVIDDDDDICAVLTTVLEAEGYCVVCTTGGAVLQLVETTQPDVILLDVMMPVLDGAVISELLRTYSRTAQVPIIAISGMRQQDAPIDLLYDAWLSKPFDLSDLFRVVAMMTDRKPSAG